MKMYDLKDDPKIDIICRNIVRTVPAISIFVCGSRATGYGVRDSSDYDIGVVMRTLSIPFYLGKLKRLEWELSREINSSLAINPLPTFKLHRARGNYFLFKLKREGITIYGQNCLEELSLVRIEDIDIYWGFSYLFSAIKRLVQDFDLVFTFTQNNNQHTRAFIQGTAKALLKCGEIHLLLNRVYEADPERMITKLCQFSFQGIEKNGFMMDMGLAHSIRKDELELIPDPVNFWFRTKSYATATFGILISAQQKREVDDLKGLIQEYCMSGDRTRLKNLQYFTLALLAKKKLFWRSLTTGASIEKRVWLALMWLLLAVNEAGQVDRECLLRGYEVLKAYASVDYSDDNVILWNNLKESIMVSYPIACTVMGI